MELRQLMLEILEGTYYVPAEEVAAAILEWFTPTDPEAVLRGHSVRLLLLPS
jgi:hypothetical protein